MKYTKVAEFIPIPVLPGTRTFITWVRVLIRVPYPDQPGPGGRDPDQDPDPGFFIGTRTSGPDGTRKVGLIFFSYIFCHLFFLNVWKSKNIWLPKLITVVTLLTRENVFEKKRALRGKCVLRGIFTFLAFIAKMGVIWPKWSRCCQNRP